MAKQPEPVPDGHPNVDEGMTQIQESQDPPPDGHPDVSDGLTSLTGGGGRPPSKETGEDRSDSPD